MTVPIEEAPANYVPAAAVIRRVQALSGFTGCKASVGCNISQMSKLPAQPVYAFDTVLLESRRGKWNSQCSGEMRRDCEEHQWRRRLPGLLLTLRLESVGSKQD